MCRRSNTQFSARVTASGDRSLCGLFLPCLFMAISGLPRPVTECLLLGPKRTRARRRSTSGHDPKQTLALWHPRHAHAASEAHAAREKGRIVARSEGAEATESKARVERKPRLRSGSCLIQGA
jgi:hypothetical protein